MAPLANAPPPLIRHRPEQQRFETVVDGQHGELDYRIDGGVMAILHTGVAPAIQGRGIAAALTHAALAHARATGWKVRPRCSYARSYFERHPESADLLG